MKNIHLPFKVMAAALFVGLILPVLIQEGMFMDGLLYTCVSKNLGNGIGTFWFPKSSETWTIAGMHTFHEHPPLVFGIQSLFFSALGNSIYVERFYSLLTACITALLIVVCWKELFKNNDALKKYYWVPVILWIIIPVVHWSFQNNMQENTMGIFTLSSIYLMVKSYNNIKWQVLYIIVAACLIFLASLSKGVPGLFPIGFIGLHWLLFRKINFVKTTVYTLLLIAIPTLIYYLLLQNPNAIEALSFYLNERLLGRTEAAHTVTNRFHTLIAIVSQLLPSLIIVAILIFVFWRKKIKGLWEEKKNFLLFLFIGLSGTLPLMLTMVQKDFYFSHSIPYYAISLGLLIIKPLSTLIEKINIDKKGFRIFKISAITLLVAAIVITFTQIGNVSRNPGLIADVHKMAKVIPENSTIKTTKELEQNWDLRLNFVRHYYISLTYVDVNHKYYVTRKEDLSIDLEKYQKVGIETKEFDLYQIKESIIEK